MTAEIPEFVTAEGNVKAAFVTTIANLAAPTATELNAGQDISHHLMPDWDGPGGEQSTGDQRRFSSRQTFQVLGRTSRNVSPISYTYLPQMLGTPGSDGNEVYEALVPGTEGFLVTGYGVDPDGVWAASDVVDILPVECGERFKGARGEDEFAPLTVMQSFGVKGVITEDSEVA
jgi:hypothetical protein